MFRLARVTTQRPPTRPVIRAKQHVAFQAGTAEEDSFHDAAVASASSVDAQGLERESTTIVLAGVTRGDWSGAGSSGEGSDFAALGLDADGSELWRWQVICTLRGYP